jgi:hypothetical protein
MLYWSWSAGAADDAARVHHAARRCGVSMKSVDARNRDSPTSPRWIAIRRLRRLLQVSSISKLPKIAVVASVASFLAVGPSSLHAQSECNAQQILRPGNCIGDDLDSLEIELARQINDYRAQNGLPAIPLSPALSLVANRHVRDLAMNIGRLTHDWSNCAMTDPSCMWMAPERLGTSYPGNGFENAYGGPAGSRPSPAAILESWKEEGNGPHNDVILNRRVWSNVQWKALGIGIYYGFAAMWVGSQADLHEKPLTKPVLRTQ